jgi:hypothetical protein
MRMYRSFAHRPETRQTDVLLGPASFIAGTALIAGGVATDAKQDAAADRRAFACGAFHRVRNSRLPTSPWTIHLDVTQCASSNRLARAMLRQIASNRLGARLCSGSESHPRKPNHPSKKERATGSRRHFVTHATRRLPCQCKIEIPY